MLSEVQKQACTIKLNTLGSPFIKNFIIGICADLNAEQKKYTLRQFVKIHCESLNIPVAEVFKDE